MPNSLTSLNRVHLLLDKILILHGVPSRMAPDGLGVLHTHTPVSYTHLDVYKRQVLHITTLHITRPFVLHIANLFVLHITTLNITQHFVLHITTLHITRPFL